MIELNELRSLTSDTEGAQRVAFTPMGEWARIWLGAKLEAIPGVEVHADEAIRETCGTSHRLPAGPLHDAAEMCGAGGPTVMMFRQSLHGISQNKMEDIRENQQEACGRAFDRLVDKTQAWIVGRN